ncbi:RNA-directed DNA polymerase, eukaryota, Reverse transcriptase zinc-binding domain protein [Artemisia annua]|uniref:RNA-directed DNA polymerase, eukaryota, Reverse transcriptase zinc-binding domain protein n=1 Tax=Artemisia annua TaxID=35608 RepID=A0A2U1KBM4_ARTAN|nr:RNA-directed DNA polymerase, eukaryota, Reverse transcriptase zinc-binding domain protein [Artemisia annua]
MEKGFLSPRHGTNKAKLPKVDVAGLEARIKRMKHGEDGNAVVPQPQLGLGCVEVIEVFDVNRSGLQFTWNQKPRGTDGKLKRIDRIMANLACTDVFIGAHAIFQPYRISDHSPAILTIPTSHKFTPRPFKFYNIIVHNSQFKGKVKEFWDMDGKGCVITNKDGVQFEGEDVPNAFVSYYAAFLGQEGHTV